MENFNYIVDWNFSGNPAPNEYYSNDEPSPCRPAVYTGNTASISFSGNGSVCDPLYANLNISHQGGNAAFMLSDGLYISGSSASLTGAYLPLSGGTLTGALSGTTFYGDGSHLTGIVNIDNNRYITGSTFTNNNLVLADNSGGTVSTLINNFSGLTVNGSVITSGNYLIDNGLGTMNMGVDGTGLAYLAFAYANYAPNRYIIKVDGSNSLLFQNVGGANALVLKGTNAHAIFGGLADDSGGSYIQTPSFQMIDGNQSAGKVLFSDANGNASWGTISGASSFDTKITGGTFVNNLLTLTNNTGGTVSVLLNSFSGLTVNGSVSASTLSIGTLFINGVQYSASTPFSGLYLSATTLSGNVLTVKNSTGSTVNSTVNAITGGSYSNGIITVSGTGAITNITGLPTSFPSVIITGGTFLNNTLNLTNNTGGTVSVVENSFTALTVNGIISASTISGGTLFGNGSNLTGINNTYTTGGTFANNTLTLTNNSGGTVSTIINNFTGLTVNGSISAATVSATSLNLGALSANSSTDSSLLSIDANGNVHKMLLTLITGTTGGATGATIYNADGTLAGNRIVNQSSFNIIFSGSGSGSNKFSVYEAFEAGVGVTASGQYSHAEGSLTQALGQYSHAEGSGTTASANYTHSEGLATSALTFGSHVEGWLTQTNAIYSHAEGESTKSTANGQSSHAEGVQTTTNAQGCHAEGYQSQANGYTSHAEGVQSTTNASYSHAEGYQTNTVGVASHSEGLGTIADRDYMHVSGRYNITGNTPNCIAIIGTGLGTGQRADALRVDLLSSASTTAQITHIGNTVFSGSSTPLQIVGLTASTTDTGVLTIDSTGIVHKSTTLPSITINGSFSTPIVTKLAAYTATTLDSTILCNASGGTFTLTLPNATTTSGVEYLIKKINTGNTVTVSANTLIDSASTYSLSTIYKYVAVQSNGVQWYIIGQN